MPLFSTGDTVEDLWTDVLTRSPVENNGKKYVAYTRWHVSWKFWWHKNAGSCDISDVETVLDVTYTLPRLDQASSTPEPVARRWEKYYAALFSHEQGHKDIGIRAARDIETQIAAMGPRQTCAQLENDANEIGMKVVDRYSRLEKDYDRSTNHGLNTGAVFP